MKSHILIDGKKISYSILNPELLDKSTIIVFLHDGLGSIKQWGRFPEKISDELKMPALLYDRFGHGESDDFAFKKDKDFFNKETDCLIDILDALNIKQKVILTGSSDGGTISLVSAANHPGKIKGLITLAAHVFVEDKTVGGVKILKEKFIRGNLKKALEKYHSSKTEKLFNCWAELWISDEFRDWNIFEDLKKIICPVLAIQGDDDEFGTEEQLNAIKKYLKSDCTVNLIKGTKHFPYLDKEREVMELIKKFIADKLT